MTEIAPNLHIVLVRPEIPQNTGSIARLAAATKCRLHLVGPLGFSLEDRYLKRAGLDYWPYVPLSRHDSWETFRAALPGRRLGFSARATDVYTDLRFRADDVLVFGGETRGLPATIRDELAPALYRIPITSPHVRSLNVANAVSIVLYEALRQLGAAQP